MRILIVEDDESLRAELQISLSDMGYQCDAAENGLRGYEKISADEYDLVLTDIQMPIWDGMKLLTMAKAMRPNLPFFVLCDSLPKALREELEAIPNVMEMRAKPVKMLTLLEGIGEYFAHTRKRPPRPIATPS